MGNRADSEGRLELAEAKVRVVYRAPRNLKQDATTTAPSEHSMSLSNLRSHEQTNTLSRDDSSKRPKDRPQSRFARFGLPIIPAVLIDGISEALKGFGTFITKEISDDVMFRRVEWDGVFALVVGTGAMILALYFVIKEIR
jgi:hypothetical protein